MAKPYLAMCTMYRDHGYANVEAPPETDLDPEKHEVDIRVAIKRNELELLCQSLIDRTIEVCQGTLDECRVLAERRSRVVFRDELFREVWGFLDTSTTRSLDRAVSRLRQKIEKAPHAPELVLRPEDGDATAIRTVAEVCESAHLKARGDALGAASIDLYCVRPDASGWREPASPAAC